jgi:hypothetical protein
MIRPQSTNRETLRSSKRLNECRSHHRRSRVLAISLALGRWFSRLDDAELHRALQKCPRPEGTETPL